MGISNHGDNHLYSPDENMGECTLGGLSFGAGQLSKLRLEVVLLIVLFLRVDCKKRIPCCAAG